MSPSPTPVPASIFVHEHCVLSSSTNGYYSVFSRSSQSPESVSPHATFQTVRGVLLNHQSLDVFPDFGGFPTAEGETLKILKYEQEFWNLSPSAPESKNFDRSFMHEQNNARYCINVCVCVWHIKRGKKYN